MLSELKETEETMKPLRLELQGVEEKIREYQAQIVAAKVRLAVLPCFSAMGVHEGLFCACCMLQSSIIRNDSRIQELLKFVVAK